MPNVTLRLSDQDHELLRLACLVVRKSQNKLLTELLHGEIDRVLPGRRRPDRAAPDLDEMWEAAGLPRPSVSDVDRDQVRADVEAAARDTDRFWAEHDAQRRSRAA